MAILAFALQFYMTIIFFKQYRFQGFTNSQAKLIWEYKKINDINNLMHVWN